MLIVSLNNGSNIVHNAAQLKILASLRAPDFRCPERAKRRGAPKLMSSEIPVGFLRSAVYPHYESH